MTLEHLVTINAEEWPGVASVPTGVWMPVRARKAEANFARVCRTLEITLSGDADVRVEHEALFLRIAESGWTGFAESYMAGEWRTRDDNTLVEVLAKLIAHGYRPKTPTVPTLRALGQLPPALVRLFSGDGTSAFNATYASGVATTVRHSVPSHVPGAGRGQEPAHHFVDVTTVGEPVSVERADLADGQARAAERLLAQAHVRESSHVLVFPASGGQVEMAAVSARATVDAVTSDRPMYEAMGERLVLSGIADAVHLEFVDDLRLWRGRYDSIVSAEALETMAGTQRDEYIRAIDRMLATGGRAALQTTVATETFSRAARDAVQALRAYIWPGLEMSTEEELHRLVDRRTNLRIVSQAHLGRHHELSVAAQREQFASRSREAAAEGFDVVLRRLMTYQFALREALLRLDMIDGVVLGLVHRNRGGRR
ncbi:SAM-dependent methyltransferase [Corynebacterium guangdongense]|uniref:Cyclopropane-fatty-acyl-phospholipid synthase n=1 Tax=Corynebacterium guangdongense TaxID=1783348 RepID=A0ABU1ZWK3_9CORY|nr:class I SAM-dependent methyltransferase [Corynebacterium guangdongense]MDR7329316.1 cyclopropane-fatty-acyl-phospholipid synthase [Corynebacterium guangdongense]WJZ17882.1 cyclopropane fatty acyl phospholipid synthase [Corynebacterium guangdongense]